MFCPKCGTQNPDGSQFCGSCGTPFTHAPKPGSVPGAAQSGSGRTDARRGVLNAG